MKHNFEKWLEEKYKNKLISHIDSNVESIKHIFDESLICYKSGAYRSSIVMAMVGFDMIMRDRILKYKSSLEELNDPVDFKKNLIDENNWDKELMDFVINNDVNFKKIFSNKSQWQLMWKERRNMRNNAAHAKSYNIDYYDVECFYS